MTQNQIESEVEKVRPLKNSCLAIAILSACSLTDAEIIEVLSFCPLSVVRSNGYVTSYYDLAKRASKIISDFSRHLPLIEDRIFSQPKHYIFRFNCGLFDHHVYAGFKINSIPDGVKACLLNDKYRKAALTESKVTRVDAFRLR